MMSESAYSLDLGDEVRVCFDLLQHKRRCPNLLTISILAMTSESTLIYFNISDDVRICLSSRSWR
ncbi:hypothetical protein A2U01_0082407 [Trifolium medium]|uniref:Uncharacterized protein n=1 Tax=Trifolium medium TaxID=97028 RepID=A0A392TLZ6_9FABA|nr:hypothetical protein [Trifolium medium]